MIYGEQDPKDTLASSDPTLIAAEPVLIVADCECPPPAVGVGYQPAEQGYQHEEIDYQPREIGYQPRRESAPLLTMTESAGSIIRAYPGPSLLIGAGLAWMLVQRERSKVVPLPTRLRYKAAYRKEQLRGAALGAKDTLRDKASGAKESLLERASGAKESLIDKASGAKDSIVDAATGAKESIIGAARSAKDSTVGKVEDAKMTAAERAESARLHARSGYQNARFSMHERAEHARGAYDSLLEENPLLVGAVAAAVGIAFGLLLPSTQREDELLGPTRDTLLDQARTIANDARSAAVETLRSSAGSVKAHLTEAANEAKTALNDSVQNAKTAVVDATATEDESSSEMNMATGQKGNKKSMGGSSPNLPAIDPTTM